MPSKEKAEHYFSMHILKALARGLDAHTSFFSPEEAFEMRSSLEKQFEGVGVVLREGLDGIEIADLIQGGPAARSGKIVVGDILMEVDGKPVVNALYYEVLSQLKGDGRKDVMLGFKRQERDGNDSFVKVGLKREKIIMENERLVFTAEPFADGMIGKLTLPSFYESSDSTSCEADIRKALTEIRKKGKVLGLVLDMRNNLGGFLSQAVKVSGLFMTSGVVVISKYAEGEVQYLRNLDPRIHYAGPLVILTSKLSASAAEIVAQALQDYGVGIVVGDERTYGKGTIQYQTVTDTLLRHFSKSPSEDTIQFREDRLRSKALKPISWSQPLILFTISESGIWNTLLKTIKCLLRMPIRWQMFLPILNSGSRKITCLIFKRKSRLGSKWFPS